MNGNVFGDFAADARAAGVDEAPVRQWAPGWPHAQRHGPQGATYWVGRRNRH